MGFGSGEQITRRLDRPAPFSLAQVVYEIQPETGKKCFACVPLHAGTMSIDACRAQYARGSATCSGCEVGRAHTDGVKAPAAHCDAAGDFALPIQNTPTQRCIRCGRDGRDEYSKKIIGRFRTVQRTTLFLPKSSGKTTVCVSCFNRASEVRDGRNSKGAKPVKHAALREATVTYTFEGETFPDVPIGMRGGVKECRRLLERAYGKRAKLKGVRFDGEAADLCDTNDPLWVRPEDETLSDFGFGSDNRRFRAWLTEGWPTFARRRRTRGASAAPTPLYFGKTADEWATVWGVTREAAADRLKDQLDDSAALQAMREPATLPPLGEVSEPDPLEVLDGEGGMQYAPVKPSASVADCEALPMVAQPVRQPQRSPEPVKFDMKTRAGRRAFEKSARKEQKKMQRGQKVHGYPSIANTARAFVQVLFEQGARK